MIFVDQALAKLTDSQMKSKFYPVTKFYHVTPKLIFPDILKIKMIKFRPKLASVSPSLASVCTSLDEILIPNEHMLSLMSMFIHT